MISKTIKVMIIFVLAFSVMLCAKDKEIVISKMAPVGEFIEDRWIGISGRDVEPEDLAKYKLNEIAGVIVVRISKNSPASKADLREGDVILEYDDQKVMSIRALKRMVLETPIGRVVPLRVMRDGKILKVAITVEKKEWEFEIPDIKKWFYRDNDSEDVNEECPNCNREEANCIALGIELSPITEQLRKYFNAPEDAGILVSGVYKDSLAERNGLKVGDVIVKVNEQMITKPYQLKDILCNAEKDEMLKMIIIRDKEEMKLFIDLNPIKK
jgi:serine protease Do